MKYVAGAPSWWEAARGGGPCMAWEAERQRLRLQAELGRLMNEIRLMAPNTPCTSPQFAKLQTMRDRRDAIREQLGSLRLVKGAA